MSQEIVVIGLDLAKNVFQVHAIDAQGQPVVRRQLRRAEVLKFFAKLPPCLVGMEACASAHYWGWEIGALGHQVRLMPPAYVKPYVKRDKTDAADAEAICAAVTRPTMRFVAVKSEEQQAALMLHKTSDLLVRQRTMLINALRAHLGEYGIAKAQGPAGVNSLLALVQEAQDAVPVHAQSALRSIVAQFHALAKEIEHLEKQILDWHRHDEVSQRLATAPGIGPITASAIAATVPDASIFQSGRQFAAWLDLTPRPHSSGGKERLGGITKEGDGYLRRLLVVGATAVLRMTRKDHAKQPWLARLLETKPSKIASVVLANKTARIAWVIMSRGEVYRSALA
ncbi:IS110 family transposase [Blastomonas fulva]|jgi:transposase|uniref:IS110 family transposase n=1 Tax=Blastomonas fulva TaxID=1550728 RepID=UPI003D27C516